uniref:Uncharacterized protein n=1 Tax=Chelydra serpentina TaxID=8475 RepID=A0A8C3XKE5_CHESE
LVESLSQLSTKLTQFFLFHSSQTKKAERIPKGCPVWWHVPVIPAAWEAAVGGSLRSSRLLCAMSIRCPVLLTA